VIENYEEWAARMARQMLGDDLHPGTAMDWQDLAQEALIEVWRAERSFDPERSPDPEAYAKWKARNAAKTKLRPREKHVVYRRDDVGEAHREDAEDALAQLVAEDPDVLEAVIASYHRGEIRAALDALTPKQREYVVLRFWGGLTEAELTAHFGYGPSGLWGAPTGRGGARRKLAAALAHLVDA
jgi:RNA polymerase sigma factor (sigma-70 family)